MAEIDGEQYAARKLGCEISADPLNPLDPIKKVCKSHHPDEDLSILDRAYRRAVIQRSAQRPLHVGEPGASSAVDTLVGRLPSHAITPSAER